MGKPDNWDAIKKRLGERRPSLSPTRFTEKDYERFVQADADAAKEQQVTMSIIPIITGCVADTKCVSGNIPFKNLKPLTDGTVPPPNPDVYHGARPEQLDPKIREELHDLIVPSRQGDLPICPNFFVAIKGPDGKGAVARLQASYDAVTGARAIPCTKYYSVPDPPSDNNAYTIAASYSDGTLRLYTSHCQHFNNLKSQPEYAIHQLGGWSMNGTYEQFLEGATAFRHAMMDWTKEQRDEAIETANQKLKAEELIPTASSFSSVNSDSTVRDALILSQESTQQDDFSSTTPSLPDTNALQNELLPGHKRRRHTSHSDVGNGLNHDLRALSASQKTSPVLDQGCGGKKDNSPLQD